MGADAFWEGIRRVGIVWLSHVHQSPGPCDAAKLTQGECGCHFRGSVMKNC